MPLRSEAYYARVADAALESLGVVEPPVPIETLVDFYGIPVRAVNLPQFFTAATVHEDGLPVIVVNSAQSEPVRRRAMAHLMGHVLLLLEGDTGAYPKSSGEHQEADILARFLMMPATMVIEQSRLWFNDHRYLARMFGVSEEDMITRMTELGLIRSRNNQGWDY